MDWITIMAITIALSLIGFFSGIETAFISVSKLSIELKKKQGSYTGKIWSAFMEKPSRFIGTTLVIFNILLVIYGLLWSDILENVWKYWNISNPYILLAAETLIATFLLLFFEFLFKAFFRAKGNAIMSSGFITFIVKFFYSLFSWIARYFVNIAEWILRYILNVKLQNKTEVFSKIDLEHYIQQLKMNDSDDMELNNEIF